MKEHFNLKSLKLYGIMIGSVLVLFKAVTAYGETRLRAPLLVAGNYQIDLQSLPECLGTGNINLNLEQSGIYLFGNLLIKEQKIVLDGKFHDGRIFLSGQTNQIAECEISEEPNAKRDIQIEGRTQDRKFLGEIKWNSSPQGIQFTGTLEEKPVQSELEH
ncbi:MAG: hypothetical protein MUD14_04385 [Hydrococcus sp. Prado102]|jgi:hypothetical protein|nr:hypothetical protein [Hydrococcus sp. Prado102]